MKFENTVVLVAQVFVVLPPVLVEKRIARKLALQLDEIPRVTYRGEGVGAGPARWPLDPNPEAEPTPPAC